MWELWMHLDYGHLHIQHFSGEKSLLLCGSRFLKNKKKIWKATRKKRILPLEKYFKTLKNMILGTVGT